MKRIFSAESNTPLINLPDSKHHINALKKLNLVRKKLFGTELEDGWDKYLDEFAEENKNIPNITKPVKIHILLSHCKPFILQYGNGKGLGFYSEQTGESIHQKIEPIFNKCKI